MSSTDTEPGPTSPTNIEYDFYNFPPGTVTLEASTSDTQRGEGQLILHPVPTSDPNDPLNWSTTRKNINFAIISFYTFMIFTILGVGVVCWATWVVELGFTFDGLTNVFASNLAGLALGCVLFIPFALKFGRRVVYLASSLVSFGAAVWMAKSNKLAEFIANNLISGLAGAASETLIQITIGDMFFVHQRGTYNGAYLLMVTCGASLGPMAAGFIIDGQGWRWLFWWCSIFLGVSFLSFVFLYEDTKYIPTLDGQGTPKISAPETKEALDNPNSEKLANVRTASTTAGINTIPMKTYRQRMVILTRSPGGFSHFSRHFYQPFIILATIPAVAYSAIIYGSSLSWYSLIATTQPQLFAAPPYLFKATGIGLLSIPTFIGAVFGVVYGGPLSDWSIKFFARRNNGIYEPEMRLYLNIFPALMGPAGIWVYGMTTLAGYHWIVPCVGIALYGFSLSALCDTSITYVIDSYREIIGDSFVGIAFIRNGLSMMMTFVRPPWIKQMGMRNMFILAGALSLVVNLSFIPMIVFGKRWRRQKAERYRSLAGRQFDPRAI